MDEEDKCWKVISIGVIMGGICFVCSVIIVMVIEIVWVVFFCKSRELFNFEVILSFLVYKFLVLGKKVVFYFQFYESGMLFVNLFFGLLCGFYFNDFFWCVDIWFVVFQGFKNKGVVEFR